MRKRDLALRLSIVFLVAGIIALLAGLYEIDRRGKSSSATLAANVAEIEQRIQVLVAPARQVLTVFLQTRRLAARHGAT
jgi:hypothetical protein